MIELYRAAESATGAALEETLRELCVAHRVITVEAGDEGPLPPYLVESGRQYAGDAIPPFLAELRAELSANRMVSGDSCYIDPRSGKVC